MESVEAALDSARDAVSDLADGASGWWGDRVDEVRSKLEERRGGKGADSNRRGGKRRSGSGKKESSPQEGANTGGKGLPVVPLLLAAVAAAVGVAAHDESRVKESDLERIPHVGGYLASGLRTLRAKLRELRSGRRTGGGGGSSSSAPSSSSPPPAKAAAAAGVR